MVVPTAPETLDGWFVFHDFRTIRRHAWYALQPQQRRLFAAGVAKFYEDALAAESRHLGSSAVYRVIGHKADLLFLHVRPSVEAISEIESDFDRLDFASFCERPYSYLSVVELSTHGSQGKSPELAESLRDRLEPNVPRARYLSFYPMSKLRDPADNWYMLDAEARRDLMRSHGQIGRKYQGSVRQIISGSMGLDDWEWGVDLFSDDALQFKKIVYEMRFDEVSARFGLFGPFFVGVRLEPDALEAYLSLP
jgi:peroxiredoxin